MLYFLLLRQGRRQRAHPYGWPFRDTYSSIGLSVISDSACPQANSNVPSATCPVSQIMYINMPHVGGFLRSQTYNTIQQRILSIPIFEQCFKHNALLRAPLTVI